MSNEDRQRILREAGHRPAEAEKEASAQAAKEAGDDDSPEPAPQDVEQSQPLAEDPDGPPRPRR